MFGLRDPHYPWGIWSSNLRSAGRIEERKLGLGVVDVKCFFESDRACCMYKKITKNDRDGNERSDKT
jgi:hypothetical protein